MLWRFEHPAIRAGLVFSVALVVLGCVSVVHGIQRSKIIIKVSHSHRVTIKPSGAQFGAENEARLYYSQITAGLYLATMVLA